MLSRFSSKAKQALKMGLPEGPQLRTILHGPARGSQMEMNLHDGGLRYLLGAYERELVRPLRNLCRRSLSAFDVGSNVGYDTLVLGSLLSGDILSVECDAGATKTLRRNVAANFASLGQDRVQVAQVRVVSHQDSPLEATIDSLAAQYFQPDLIKMDIEGAEVDGLEGARGLLMARKPHLVIETHSSSLERECVGIVQSYGYDPVVINQARLLPDFRPLKHNRWLVCDGR